MSNENSEKINKIGAEFDELIKLNNIFNNEIPIVILKNIISNPGITGKVLALESMISPPLLNFYINKFKNLKIVNDIKVGLNHTYYISWPETNELLENTINNYSNFLFIAKEKQESETKQLKNKKRK